MRPDPEDVVLVPVDSQIPERDDSVGDALLLLDREDTPWRSPCS